MDPSYLSDTWRPTLARTYQECSLLRRRVIEWKQTCGYYFVFSMALGLLRPGRDGTLEGFSLIFFFTVFFFYFLIPGTGTCAV